MADWTVTIGGSDVTEDVEAVAIISGSREGGEATLEVRGLNPTSFAPVVIQRAGVNLFRGRVGTLSAPHDGSQLFEGEIRCDDQVTALRHLLVSEQYEAPVSGIVEAVMTKYAPHLALSIEPVAIQAQYKYNYLSLLEVLRGLAQAGGTRFSASDGTFYWFRETWGPTITLPLSAVSTPYDYAKDPSELINDVYVIGGVSRAPYAKSWVADGSDTYTYEQRDLVNVTIKVDDAQQQVALEGFTAPDSVQVFLNPADRTIRFKAAPAAGSVIALAGQYDYTVLERVQDPASIATYGRLQQVINDTAILDKATARAVARNALQSQPKERLYCDLVDFQPITAGRRLKLPWLDRYGVVTQSIITLGASDSVRLEVELL